MNKPQSVYYQASRQSAIFDRLDCLQKILYARLKGTIVYKQQKLPDLLIQFLLEMSISYFLQKVRHAHPYFQKGLANFTFSYSIQNVLLRVA
jgi:hypothetical protein